MQDQQRQFDVIEGGRSSGGWAALDRKPQPQRTEYDPLKFYTVSTDEKGHDRQLNLRLPPIVHARVKKLVEDKLWPQYDSPDAFARDAIVHRLAYIADATEDSVERTSIGALLQMYAIRHDIAETNQMMALWEETNEALEGVFRRLEAEQADEELLAMIERTEDGIDCLEGRRRDQVLTICREWRKNLQLRKSKKS